MKINEAATKELVEELMTREGVEVIKAEPHEYKTCDVNGPAIILIVTD